MSEAALEAAAALADRGIAAPPAREARCPGPVDPQALVEILRANKVPLLDLAAGPQEIGLSVSPVWDEAVARERLERDELLARFDRVASLFHGEGIEPILFKSPGGLPYRSSNLDVLVRPSRMAEAARLLTELGHLNLPHYREQHKLLFRRFERGRSTICVHLHEAVSWGRVLILPGDDVVERALAVPGASWKAAAREDLLLITLAHSLYETDQVRLADLRTLRSCAAAPGFDWEVVIERARASHWTTGFFSILIVTEALERALLGFSRVPAGILQRGREVLAGQRWAAGYVESATRRLRARPPSRMPYPISKLYSKRHYVARLLAEPSRSPDERLADLVATFWNLAANRLHLRCRPAVILALSGLDGSGKSSAVRAVNEALALCEVPARIVWSRGGFGSWMEAFKRTARTALPGRVPGPTELEAKTRWLSRPGLGAAFAALVVAEQGLHYILRVRLPRLAGVSIVCDRFAYDTAADLSAKLGPGRLAAAASSLLIAMAPRPDLAILLEVTPSTAARRKPGDAPRQRLESQAAALADLARGHAMVIIGAEGPDAEVVGEVVNRSLGAVFSRFGARSGGRAEVEADQERSA